MSNNPQAQKEDPLSGLVPCVAVAFGRQVTLFSAAHKLLLLHKVELSIQPFVNFVLYNHLELWVR